MSIGNWYRVGTVAVTNGSVNVVGTGTFWTSQCNPGDRFTVDGENWYEVYSITDDTHLALLSVGGSGAFAGATASNLAYAIDRNFTNNLNANIAASVASLVAQYQANSNGPLSGLFGNGAAATPGIAFLNEVSTGLFHPATGIAALAVQGAEFLRAVGTAAGVPAMLGLGQTAPANALDVLTTNNALYGARIQNGSAGTAARAALQIGNTSAAAQVLNLGVNGAGFTANGVLAPSRGFVEGPNGVDFASAVTSGTAFSWGVGAAYAQKMSIDYQGFVSIASGGRLGIGMAPTNVLDITQSTNAPSLVSLLNSNNGSAAYSAFQLANGGTTGLFVLYGSGWTTSGLARQNGAELLCGGAGGLTIATSQAQPIYFGTNNTQVAMFDASGRQGLGATPSAWGGAFSVLDLGTYASVASSSGGGAYFSFNSYYNGAAWIAKNTGVTANIAVGPSGLSYNFAPSVSAGSASAPVQMFGIDASGNLLVGITSASNHAIVKAVATDGGNAVLGIGNGSVQVANFFAGSVFSPNSAHCVFNLAKDNTTGRSANLTGTLNASGADYAEYRQLIAALYGSVAKGALLGYNAAGLMTNVFADVVGRVLPKSTAPSYVGNDTWGTVEAIVAGYSVADPGQQPAPVAEPVAPTVPSEPTPPATVADPGPEATPDQAAAYAAYLGTAATYTQELAAYTAAQAAVAAYPAQLAAYKAYVAAEATYQANLTAFNAALETERVKWDRIALCGVVPVNVAGLTAADIGKHLVPCAASDGTITATAVAKADLTLMQYIDSFGTIEMIGSDGRPLVNVKNG